MRRFARVTWTALGPKVAPDGSLVLDDAGSPVTEELTRVIFRPTFEEGLTVLESSVALVEGASGTVEDVEADETDTGLIDKATVRVLAGGSREVRP